jgi:hypothetical protein
MSNVVCRKWYSNVACTSKNGLIHLKKLYKEWKKDATKKQNEKQIKESVSKKIGSMRPRIYYSRKTNENGQKRKIGDMTSEHPEEKKKRNDVFNPVNNPKWNPVNNPVNDQKLKKQRREKDLQYMRDHPECGNHLPKPLTDEEIIAIIDEFISTREIEGFPGSFQDLVENLKIVIYFGINISYYYLFLVIIL